MKKRQSSVLPKGLNEINNGQGSNLPTFIIDHRQGQPGQLPGRGNSGQGIFCNNNRAQKSLPAFKPTNPNIVITTKSRGEGGLV